LSPQKIGAFGFFFVPLRITLVVARVGGAWPGSENGTRQYARSPVMATKDSPFPKILYPEWQNDYEAALAEPDREKLAELVAAAETAIFIRLHTILQSAEHRAEHQAIENALAGLRVLKRDKLGFPDWEKK
jgi:hypothetical protein